jgi:hypothetical protein
VQLSEKKTEYKVHYLVSAIQVIKEVEHREKNLNQGIHLLLKVNFVSKVKLIIAKCYWAIQTFNLGQVKKLGSVVIDPQRREMTESQALLEPIEGKIESKCWSF